MTKEPLVSDYMREVGATIRSTDTFKTAVRLMIQHQTNGLVVTDKQGKVCGILSSWDIIKYVVPDYLEEDRVLAKFESGEEFVDRTHKLADEPISKFMTSNVRTIEKSASLMEAAATLAEFHIRQLPVVDEHGKLIGYLNRTDIKRAVGDILNVASQ